MGIRGLAAAVIVTFAASGCGGIIDPSKNTVTPFTGIFDVGGADTAKSFSASRNGEFFVTLTALAPDSTAIVGMGYGQQTSTGCGIISSNVVVVGQQAFGGQINKGNYCIQVYDSGYSTLSGPQAYTIRISAP